jgi:hypothetical protein
LVSSDPFDDNKNLPPWLRDVPLPPRPRAQDVSAASAQSPNTDITQQGSCGQSFGAAPAAPAEPASEPGNLPNWLRDSQPESAPAPGAEQLPSWLRDIAGPLEPEAPAVPPAPPPAGSAPSASNMPDWLSDSEPESAPAGSEQLPDWLRDIAGDT